MEHADASPWLLFTFADELGRPAPQVFTRPAEIVAAYDHSEVRAALCKVQEGVNKGLYAAGYVAYEAAPAFDPALHVRQASDLPLLWFGLFRSPADQVPPRTTSFEIGAWQPSVNKPRYTEHIARIHAAIAAGRTYQSNYTLRLRAPFAGDSWGFFTKLQRAQPASYCAYLDTGRFHILSVSPELFFDWRGGRITTKPMKGTAPRGRFLEEDQARVAWLQASPKNRAENLMIVDLLRNDLGRIAAVGTVEVPQLFVVERYPTVLQMTSTITAETRPGTTLEEVFTALFPCGSVTGAPKASTMQLLTELEDSARGVYCGAIGLIRPDGAATFNVAIRTVVIDAERGTAEYGVGGGITWDSTAGDEYAEALAKAALLSVERPPFELLETLRLEHGSYKLLEQHLQRLSSSAKYFDIPLAPNEIRALLDQHAREYGAEARRVRLLVAENGAARVASQPLPAPSVAPLKVALAHEPVRRENIWLAHKTTNRRVYEALRAAQPDYDEILLWNESGELTEFVTGNLVVELDGQLWTPPRECGLLAGTLRATLIERGIIRERTLRLADLERSTRFWLINSVRGWVPAELKPRTSVTNT